MLTRRRFTQLGAMSGVGLALGGISEVALRAQGAGAPADFAIEIGPYLLEASPKHRFQTIAYNGQVPGPLLRMKQGRRVTFDIHNRSTDAEVVHFHGLFLPPEIDGAMEEGSPMIAPGASARISFAPDPAGFRWFHTHTFAGGDLRKGQYGGQHGFLMVDPSDARGELTYDREVFLALHDWGGREMASDDGSMMAVYEVSTINGKMLGFGEPVRVKQGERVMMHVLNSSPTEVHWVALAGHSFRVIALDGNAVPRAQTVEMLRLAPAERVSAIVTMNAPGVWVLGEVRRHVQAVGMGIVVEYANATGAPKWMQPAELVWDYAQFAEKAGAIGKGVADKVIEIPLVFDSKFEGHGNAERWRINGKSYPDTESPVLQAGRRYRLVMKNLSADDHPIHLHRHTFEVTRVGDTAMRGLMKDVVLIPAHKSSAIEFTASHPGNTLFHCHQQDHMDRGFMMVFRYWRNARTIQLRVLVAVAMAALFAPHVRAQGNYEIQVYGADTVAPKNLMVELHSNFTPEGQKNLIDGVYPTNHQEHETVELTEGLNSWSEIGFYIFTSEQAGHGVQWVGDHIRPRVRVPDRWHWPVGVSLSTEVGYQRAVYSPDTWTWELRPIVDKTVGRWYFAINPALERTWHGPDVAQGLGFAPGAKIGYDLTKVVNAGFEYYADYGRLGNFDKLHDQQQQLFVVTDLNVSPKWEINIGVGVGPTAATDHLIVKGILGRRFDWGHHSPVD